MSKGRSEFEKKMEEQGIHLEIFPLSRSTRTAVEAAQAIDCQLGQIAKSIVFETASGKPVLVIASGANRIDEKKLGELLGERVHKAGADFVQKATGFAIGGVPPFGHPKPIKTFIDDDLLAFSEVWAAAGDPFSVFKTTSRFLQKASGAKVVAIAQEKA